MIPMFEDSRRKSYVTERFCTSVDHNIFVSVEPECDGSEKKTCRDYDSCKNKEKCRYDK